MVEAVSGGAGREADREVALPAHQPRQAHRRRAIEMGEAAADQDAVAAGADGLAADQRLGGGEGGGQRREILRQRGVAGEEHERHARGGPGHQLGPFAGHPAGDIEADQARGRANVPPRSRWPRRGC